MVEMSEDQKLIGGVNTSIRIPQRIRDELEAAARRNRRKLSAEIALRLAKSLELDPAPYEPMHSTPSKEALEGLKLAKKNAAQIAAIKEALKSHGILTVTEPDD